jgi:FdhD protein
VARVTRIHGSAATSADDALAAEEPLEIRVGERPVSVTLRTPGDDFDLAAGFLFTESILQSPEQITSIRHWGSPNVVRVDVNVPVDLQRLQRHFYSTSSCGVCGKVSIDALRVHAAPLNSHVRVSRDAIHAFSDALRAEQRAFDATGAIHAAGVFSSDGSLLRVREDIGRHNAVDKVIGSFFREGVALNQHLLFVSGRTSFEIIQKAIIARMPVVAAVGAPSSLAVELAAEFDLTLLGFVRDGRFNVYSAEERIV